MERCQPNPTENEWPKQHDESEETDHSLTSQEAVFVRLNKWWDV